MTRVEERSERARQDLTVSDLMRRDVVTVPGDLAVGDLAELLVERGISGAPVVDPGGRVIGVVSASDVLRLVSSEAGRPDGPEAGAPGGDAGERSDDGRGDAELELQTEAGSVSAFFHHAEGGRSRGAAALAALLPPAPFGARTVREIMMPARFSVRPSTTLGNLARFLVSAKVHRALVMEGGTLRGIVTTFDVLRAIAAQDVVSEEVP